ncbi:unnamed protein product [Diamesa serratosioi]
MDFLLLRHRKKSLVVPVPDGLKELMADISREVLRSQPEKIELFIADYLEAMLLTRELYYIAEQTVEDVIEAGMQIKELLQQSGISLRQAESAVEVIREEFRNNIPFIKAGSDGENPINEIDIITRLVTECQLTTLQAKKASLIIESSYQHFYDHNSNNKMDIGPVNAWNDNVRNTLTAYQKQQPNTKLGDKTRVKSNHAIYKRYFERKTGSKIQDKNLDLCKKPKERLDYWQSPLFQEREHASNVIKSWYKHKKELVLETKAAIVIQSHFKGFLDRKKLEISLSKSKVCAEGYWKTPCFQNRDKAAVVIQSWLRAIQVKKDLHLKQRAAKIIQSHYRGFKVRKTMKQEPRSGSNVIFEEYHRD